MSQFMPAIEKRKTSDVLIPTFSAPAGAARFEQFQDITNRLVLGLSQEQQLIMCVLSYEGVTNYQSLLGCLGSCSERFQISNENHVIWKHSGAELCSRSLDARTRIAASRVSSTPDWPQELIQFKTFLLGNYPGGQQCMARDIWDMVFHDTTAWLYLHIPKVVLGMLIGEITYTSLPKDVLLRAHKIHTSGHLSAIIDPDISLSPAHDQAMVALVDEENEGGKARYLPEILDLFAGTSSEDVRLSDSRWRTNVEIRLAGVAELISANGTHADAVLLLWVHYLLTVGSLRLQNPSVATVARYLKAIGKAISDELGNTESSAVHMEEDEWFDLFAQLAESVVTDEQRTSLAAFHKFCVDVFGIQPQAKVLFSSKGADVQVHANLVWDHEIDLCFAAVDSIADDSRVCQSVRFMLAMAVCFPLRIGELQALRLEDFSVVGDVVEVRYHPRSSQHQGKSRSAKRVMRSSNARWIGHVISWLKQRTLEEVDGLGARALVLGDPHRPLKSYRFGMCSRLLNTLLKHVTGDRVVSFHTLRHAWVSRAVLHVIQQAGDVKTVDPLQEISVQVGHNDVRTTLHHYFHLPVSALRISLDHVFKRKEIPTATAAFWLNVSGSALRKAKQRAFQKSAYYWSRLQHHTLSMSSLDLSIDNTPDEMLPAKSVKSIPVTLNLVRQVFADLKQGFTLQAVCSRIGIEQKYVAELLQAALTVLDALDLHQGLADDAPRHASPENQWIWVKKKMSVHSITVDLRMELTIEKLLAKQVAAVAPTQHQKRAVRAWLVCKWGSGLSIKNSSKAEPLLTWLSEGGVPAACLVLRLPADGLDSTFARAEVLSSNAATSAEAAVSNLFGRGYVVELVQRRLKTDGPYLLVGRVPVTHKVGSIPPAMLRMGRLHGLLFSMAVWIEMNDKDANEKR